jgi:hypothetical protein
MKVEVVLVTMNLRPSSSSKIDFTKKVALASTSVPTRSKTQLTASSSVAMSWMIWSAMRS